MRTFTLRCLLILTPLVILIGSAFPVGVSANSLQTDGPGGVGVTDGSSNLELWLKAGAGVYTNNTCTTAATNTGDPVACWADQSGNSYNVTQIVDDNYRPSLQTGVNSQPVTSYDGTDYLERVYTPELNPASFTIFGVWESDVVQAVGTYRSPLSSRSWGSPSPRGYSFFAEDVWEFWIHNGSTYLEMGSVGVVPDQWQLIAGEYSGGEQRIYVNGALNGVPASRTYVQNNAAPLRIGVGLEGTSAYNFYFLGDIGEIIIFGTALNDVERTLVHNYLSAKYNITLGAGDHYDGDTNGDFDLGVAGIGRDGTNSHTESHSQGMIIQNSATSPFLQDAGDWLLFGYKGGNNQTTIADLPSGWTGTPARWSRHWYVDVTDASSNGGRVNIIFDMSDSGITGYTAGNQTYYRLLGRSGTTEAFGEVASTCYTGVSTAGDRITFSGVSVSCLGSNFTVGTTNNTSGPLGPAPTAITLASFEAVPQADGILVTWETALELDNVGFNLYRSTAIDGEYVLLNDTLIPSQAPGSVLGAVYTWLDTEISPNQTYYYKLEDIDIHGASTLTEPVSTTFTATPNVVGIQNLGVQTATGLIVLGVFAAFSGVAFFRRRR